jgi:hypothetical protein
VYGLIWRRLPGPVPVRAVLAAVLVAAVVVALFRWGFPAVAPYLPFNNGAVSR